MPLGSGMIGPSDRFKYPYGQPPPPPSNIYTPEQAYPAAIKSAGEGYDEIMGGYRNILSSKPSSSVPSTLNEIMQRYRDLTNPTGTSATAPYSQSADVTSAMSGLKGLATTGGYADADIANLRARAVSPVRAVYANAMRNLDRQRSLSGGYAPGYAGAATRMAREQSEQVAGASTNVNAQLAQMIAEGKQRAAPQYASFAGEEASRALSARNRGEDITRENTLQGTRGMTDIAQLMRQSEQDELGSKERALSGMTSIYGTTPALANLFGNQAMEQTRTALQYPQPTPNMTGGMMVGGGARTGGFGIGPTTQPVPPFKIPPYRTFGAR